METNQIQEQIKIQELTIQREKVGRKRHISQVSDTFFFELKKNFKNAIVMLSIFLGIFILSLIINEIMEAQNISLPENPTDYITTYLSMIKYFIAMSACTLGGSIIAEDFKKQTGNLLFPKISKGRLLTGRLIARFSIITLIICMNYILIGIITVIKYNWIPIELWASMGWALFYAFTILIFVTFMSSFLRSTAATILISMLFLLIVFDMTGELLQVTGLNVEPLFLISYYGNIIVASLNMPDVRNVLMAGERFEGSSVLHWGWLTPSEIGAFIGLLIWTGILLTSAYLFYRRRQCKSD